MGWPRQLLAQSTLGGLERSIFLRHLGWKIILINVMFCDLCDVNGTPLNFCIVLSPYNSIRHPWVLTKERQGLYRLLGSVTGGLSVRTGLTSAIPLPTGDQEQQDCSAFGCAGRQHRPSSAAAGAATGRPEGLCQHEGRVLG